MLMLRTKISVCLIVVLAASATARADDVIPADAQPRWWKGNLHTHTFWSDGDDFPEMVAEWYRTRGYHFLGLSDHNVLQQGQRWRTRADLEKKAEQKPVVEKYLERFGRDWVEMRGEKGPKQEIRLKPLDEFRALVEERGKFLMIPAEEISDKAEGVPIHINASNIKEPLPPLGGATVVEAITNNLRNVHDHAEKAGREILAHLNHPNFGYAITAHDLAHAVLERHFEVFNGHPGVNQLGDEARPSVDRLWDIANTIRLVDLNAEPLFGVATDDSHHYHDKHNGSRPGRGWVMVRATHLTPEHILKAIKAGNYYASSGVVLKDVRYDATSKILTIEIEPDGDATFTTEIIGTLKGVATSSQDPPPLPKPKKPGEKVGGRVSRRYSDAIGKVLATQEGLKVHYQLTGKELYVRAIVTSSKPPADPAWEQQRQQAWTQPVGWELAK
jgi:predicted metal-dependent phosphoesterase TrpH